MQEYWDLLDINGNKTGEIHPRGKNLPEGKYHKCVDVWLYNNKGEVLLSKRAQNRPTFPGYWEPTGGAILAGEESLDGAVRELKEELGIDIDKNTATLLHTKTRDWDDDYVYNDLVDIWIFPFNENFNFDEATTYEVVEYCWISPKEFNTLLESKKLVDNLEYYNDIILPYLELKTK